MKKKETKKTSYEIKAEFSKKFRSLVTPIAQKYEAERKKYFKMLIAVRVVSWISALLIPIIFVPLLDEGLFRGIIGLSPFIVVIALMPLICERDFVRKLEHKIKKDIMPTICECIGNLSWVHGEYRNHRILSLAKIIRGDYDNVVIDDVFKGEHKGVKLEVVEACYTKTSGKGEDKETQTYFDGVFVVLEMNKKFKGNTVVCPNNLMLLENFGLKKTELEDVVFEKKYDVYTDDEIEARYLITPSFMERLKDMKTAFNTNWISCAFYNNQLIVAITTFENSFNVISLSKPLDNPEKYFQMFDEFLSIVKLIDYFKLDEKIGL